MSVVPQIGINKVHLPILSISVCSVFYPLVPIFPPGHPRLWLYGVMTSANLSPSLTPDSATIGSLPESDCSWQTGVDVATSGLLVQLVVALLARWQVCVYFLLGL